MASAPPKHIPKLITHKLPDNGQFRGAISILIILGCMMVGPAVPMICCILYFIGYVKTAATIATVVGTSMFLARHSARWCRFYLQAAGFFEKGVFIHIEERSITEMKKSPGMWCMHPHGTSIGFGFSLNGAVRLRAEKEDTYLPSEFVEGVSIERLRKADGVQAPVLFKVPLLRSALMGFGCATPATKHDMQKLFKNKIDFGILPGGMEEVALYTKGRERVYLKKRAGFIKYALQHGYLVQPAYTFGECDLYTSMTAGASVRMFMLKKFGFVIPIFWGPRWYMPLLPRSDIPLHTVVGSPLKLPVIPNPTNEDVAKYHQEYIEKLTEIFDTYKHKFGYGERTLEVI